MTAANRDACIKECLKWEGGYSNDAADPGGPTNWGITIIDARKYWKKDATASDVRSMPQSVAINIYTTKYWKTPYYDCDKLAPGVDLSVFDFGVNSGPARSKKYLDQAVGGTDEQTIIKLNDARLTFLKGLKTWPNFGKGWGRRVVGIKAKSLEMSKNKTGAGAVATVGAGTAAATTAAIVPTSWWTWTHALEVGVGVLVGSTILYFLIKHIRKVINVKAK